MFDNDYQNTNMKNELRIEHFIQGSKPKITDCKYGGLDSLGDSILEKTFSKDLKEWKEKYEKPEYDWIAFKDKEPLLDQLVISAAIKQNSMCFEHPYSIEIKKLFQENNLYDTHWCDKATHDAKVKKWEENQLVFDGWELSEFENLLTHTSTGHQLTIYNNESIGHFIHLQNSIGNTVYQGKCDVELFKHLGRANGF